MHTCTLSQLHYFHKRLDCDAQSLELVSGGGEPSIEDRAFFGGWTDSSFTPPPLKAVILNSATVESRDSQSLELVFLGGKPAVSDKASFGGCRDASVVSSPAAAARSQSAW